MRNQAKRQDGLGRERKRSVAKKQIADAQERSKKKRQTEGIQEKPRQQNDKRTKETEREREKGRKKREKKQQETRNKKRTFAQKLPQGESLLDLGRVRLPGFLSGDSSQLSVEVKCWVRVVSA